MRYDRLQRLAIRYQDASDDSERNRVYGMILTEIQRLPVVTGARRQTYMRVAGHSPRFADEEQQAIRNSVWRALNRYDRRRGVPFVKFVSMAIKADVRDYWRREAWRHDLCVSVPLRVWTAYRRAVGSGDDADIDCIDYDVCKHAAYHDFQMSESSGYWEENDFIEDDES